MAASRTRGPSAALPALRTHRNDTLPLSRSEAGQPSPGQGTAGSCYHNSSAGHVPPGEGCGTAL